MSYSVTSQEGRRRGGRKGEREERGTDRGRKDLNPVASWVGGYPGPERERKPYFQTHLGRGEVLRPRAVVFLLPSWPYHQLLDSL